MSDNGENLTQEDIDSLFVEGKCCDDDSNSREVLLNKMAEILEELGYNYDVDKLITNFGDNFENLIIAFKEIIEKNKEQLGDDVIEFLELIESLNIGKKEVNLITSGTSELVITIIDKGQALSTRKVIRFTNGKGGSSTLSPEDSIFSDSTEKEAA